MVSVCKLARLAMVLRMGRMSVNVNYSCTVTLLYYSIQFY